MRLLRGTSPQGRAMEVTLEGMGSVLVAFLTEGCEDCKGFWRTLGSPPPSGVDHVLIVTPDAATQDARRVADLAPPGVEVVMSTQIWLDYQVNGAPWFFFTDDGVVVAEGQAGSWDEVGELLARAGASPSAEGH